MSRKNVLTYFDITIGAKAVGRVVFEMFVDVTPKTAENFVGLCTGDYGYSKTTRQRLCYLGSKLHKVVKGSYIQGGDITNNDGTGGESIYGAKFCDENFERKHSCAGLLSMAGTGRNANSSQFLITLNPCPQYDGENVVFGRVVQGMEVVRKVADVPTDNNDRPKLPVIIFNCGMLDDKRIHIRHDQFLEQLDHFRAKEEAKEETAKDKALAIEGKDISDIAREIDQEYEISDPEEDLGVPPPDSADNPLARKLFDVKLKLNQARKQNAQAISLENQRLKDPKYEKRKRRQEWEEAQTKKEETLREKGVDESKWYMNEPLTKSKSRHEKQEKKAGKKKIVFGWEVFNQDSLHRAYKKRIKHLSVDKEEYEEQMKSNTISTEKAAEDKAQRLVDDIDRQYIGM